MTLGAFHFWPFSSEGVNVGEDALLAESMSALHEGVCEPEQSLAQFALEHVEHFLFPGQYLDQTASTIWSRKTWSR